VIDILITITVGIVGFGALLLGFLLFYMMLNGLALYAEGGVHSAKSIEDFIDPGPRIRELRELKEVEDTLEAEIERQLAILQGKPDPLRVRRIRQAGSPALDGDEITLSPGRVHLIRDGISYTVGASQCDSPAHIASQLQLVIGHERAKNAAQRLAQAQAKVGVELGEM
jgi:hypothetical protein